MEKISVVIPCYNVEDYVEKCIDSVLYQSYKNIEIICINDGSSDRTLSILQRYAKRYSHVILIDQKNTGLSGARNVGISIASGDRIMFLDSDDWLDLNCIEDSFSRGYDLICFSYNRIFKNRIERRLLNLHGTYSASQIQIRMVGLVGNELRDPSQANSLVIACAKIYRSDILKNNAVKFVDTRKVGTEDALFNIEYLEYCKGNVLIIDKPFYNYMRYNLSSLTSTYKPSLISQWRTLHQKMYMIIEHKSEMFHEAYNNRIALSIVGLGLNEVENPQGILKQLENFTSILNDKIYVKAFKNLQYQYFPLHWKMLFLLAKYQFTIGVFGMTKIMSILWKRKNK